MKPTVISAEALFEEHREILRWEWIAGHAHPERRFDEAAVRNAQSAADLVGYLNYIHPYRVQIVGRREVAYLNVEPPEVAERRISRIVTLEPPVLIAADAEPPPDKLVAMCDRADIPLFATGESAGHVIDVVRAYLSQHFAERTTRHGVFMDILGVGVLITGESGLGKSELGPGADLARPRAGGGRRGRSLPRLADRPGGPLPRTAAEPARSARHRPARHQGHLRRDRRGAGRCGLKLIVHLVRKETMDREFERLPYEPLNEEILDVPVRKTVIAVDAGRNLAVLVEAAVRNTILQLRGIDTYKEFIERHAKAMLKPE